MRIISMQTIRYIFYGLLTVAILGACAAPAPPLEIKDASRSMIFGHVEAPEKVTEVELREYGKFYIPPFVKPPRVLIYNNGNFMAENLKPGKYIISAFNTKKSDFVLVNSKRTAYQNIIHVGVGEAKFIGSYRITDIKRGLLDKGEFDVRRARKPSERRVIRHLFNVTQGTVWQAMLEHRMQELRQ